LCENILLSSLLFSPTSAHGCHYVHCEYLHYTYALMFTIPFATRIQPTGKYLTSSYTHARDQILFSDFYTTKILVFPVDWPVRPEKWTIFIFFINICVK